MATFELETPQGGKFQIDAADMTSALKALDHAQKNGDFGGQQAPASAGDHNTFGDIAKSFGTGLVKGGTGLIGIPGDLAELGTKGINALSGANLQNKVPLPTSQGIQNLVEDKITGPLHKPEGTLGQYAQTMGEFAPGMLLPAGAGTSLARKAATQVVAPALASETAGQLTQGTAAEPYARIAGALAGGVGAAKAVRTPKPNMSLDDIKGAGSAGYESPAVKDAVFAPGFAKGVADTAKGELRQMRFNDSNAKPVFDVLEDLKTPVGPPGGSGLGTPLNPPVKASVALAQGSVRHTYEDFQAARERLSELAGRFSDPSLTKAATVAIKSLDRQIESMPNGALISGDTNAFNETLARARADYAVAKAGEKVQEKLRSAELQAASANSGQNTGNATRQKLRTLLTTKKGQRGLTQDEQDAIESAVRGSSVANTLRSTGNYVGGPGGHTAAIAGFLHTGNPLMLAAPLAGRALKKAGAAVELNKANKIIEQIKQRSPTYQDALAALPPPPEASRGILPWRATLLSLLARPENQGLLSSLSKQIAP